MQAKIARQKRGIAQQEMKIEQLTHRQRVMARNNDRLSALLRRAIDGGWSQNIEEQAIAEMNVQAMERKAMAEGAS